MKEDLPPDDICKRGGQLYKKRQNLRKPKLLRQTADYLKKGGKAGEKKKEGRPGKTSPLNWGRGDRPGKTKGLEEEKEGDKIRKREIFPEQKRRKNPSLVRKRGEMVVLCGRKGKTKEKPADAGSATKIPDFPLGHKRARRKKAKEHRKEGSRWKDFPRRGDLGGATSRPREERGRDPGKGRSGDIAREGGKLRKREKAHL